MQTAAARGAPGVVCLRVGGGAEESLGSVRALVRELLQEAPREAVLAVVLEQRCESGQSVI